jgi:phosphatidylglycerophosphate synthase
MKARIPEALSLLRLLIIPIIWGLALTGNGRLVGAGLLIAGASDAADGYLARRLGQASARGARLDSLADNLLLVSALFWIVLLHPEVVRDQPVLLGVTSLVYLSSLAVGLIKFRQLGNLHLYSSKVAGGCLYGFALVTLLTGTYWRALLLLAAAFFIVSSLETLAAQLLLPSIDENLGSILRLRGRRADTSTIHAMGMISNARSQAPHSENAVGSSATPSRNSAAAATPSANDGQP